MGAAVLRTGEDQDCRPLTDQAMVFDKLRELTRNGYLPDPSSPVAGAGILLRHANAPDLILLPDGSIELPVGQTAKTEIRAPTVAGAPAVSTGGRRMFKLRALMIVILVTTFWFMSVAFTATLFEGM